MPKMDCKYIYHLIKFPLYKAKYHLLSLFDTLKLKYNRVILPSDIFLITHDLLGGTKNFTDDYIANHPNILVVKNHEYIWHLGYTLEANNSNYYITDSFFRIILKREYKTIVVNSLVKFTTLFDVMHLIEQNKQQYPSCKVEYFVHDYHSICPNFNLVKDCNYCGLQCDVLKCRHYVVYGSHRRVSIQNWRKKWNDFFSCVSVVICFSNSSKTIMTTIYPEISDKIYVKPHTVAPLNGGNLTDCGASSEMVFGFFGTINNNAKGLCQTRQIINTLSNDIKFVFVGSDLSDIGIKKENVKYIGKYSKNDLGNIITKEKIAYAIFPSVAPETFSYMLSELILLDIPVLGFEMGAQGEKLSEYHKGTCFPDVEHMIKFISSLNSNHLKMEN